MPTIARVSSATMEDLGAYESKKERINRLKKNKPSSLSPYKRNSNKKSKKSLPTNLERKMPGRDHYDGFSMKKKGGRKKARRKTRRKKKRNR